MYSHGGISVREEHLLASERLNLYDVAQGAQQGGLDPLHQLRERAVLYAKNAGFTVLHALGDDRSLGPTVKRESELHLLRGCKCPRSRHPSRRCRREQI